MVKTIDDLSSINCRNNPKILDIGNKNQTELIFEFYVLYMNRMFFLLLKLILNKPISKTKGFQVLLRVPNWSKIRCYTVCVEPFFVDLTV